MSLVAVLLTVFNRKAKTLQCLQNLYAQFPIEGYTVDVYLTDDGCTDGTPETVKEQFPDVNIIHADGNLFWNRGMYRAWSKAAETKDYDFYMWLNDDTFLLPDAISSLLSSAVNKKDSIIVAGIRSQKAEIVTYSGYYQGKLLVPNGNLQECDTFNGNCVLIPGIVYQTVGNLDWHFRHAIGDIDYGYRVRKAGFKIYCSQTYLGYCEKNPQLPVWCRPESPFIKRIKNLYSPLGYAEPIPFFRFELRNLGILTALKHFVSIHVRVCFPKLWK